MDNDHTEREKCHILMNLLKALPINSTKTGVNVEVNSKPATGANVEVDSKPATVVDDDTRLELMLASFKYIKEQRKDGNITVPNVDEELKARLDKMNATTDGLMMTLKAEEKEITCVENSICKSAEKIADFDREFQCFLDRHKDKLGSIQKWSASQMSTEELLKHFPDFELELTILFQKNRAEIDQMLREAADLDEQIDIQIQQLQEMYTKLLPFYSENKELLQRCLNSRDNNAQSREYLEQLDEKISQISGKLEKHYKIYFKNNKKPGKAIAGFFSMIKSSGKIAYRKHVSDPGEKT